MSTVKMLAAAFLAANLGAVGLNTHSFKQLDDDAQAINLAGRQRMLSQKMTKASLMVGESSEAKALGEMAAAAKVFDSTLRAFVSGGKTMSASGKEIEIPALKGEAVTLAKDALAKWEKISKNLLAGAPNLNTARRDLVEANLDLLDRMNKMTVAIEADSRSSLGTLRLIQYALFALAVVLALAVFRSLAGKAKEQEETSVSLYAALDKVSAGVLVLDASGKIRHHNKAALSFLDMDEGISPLGKPMESLMEKSATDGVWKVARSGKSAKTIHTTVSESLAELGGQRVVTMFHSGIH